MVHVLMQTGILERLQSEVEGRNTEHQKVLKEKEQMIERVSPFLAEGALHTHTHTHTHTLIGAVHQ